MFAVHLKRDPPVRSPSHLVERQSLAPVCLKHREIPREHVNAPPFSGRRDIMQKAAERVGITSSAPSREFHAAVDIPAALRARDRLPNDTKTIGAIDQQTKTISMPNAFAIANRLKERFGAHAATAFERIFEQIRRAQKRRDLGWIVPIK